MRSDCLSLDDKIENQKFIENTPVNGVHLWKAHHVMKWLRGIDFGYWADNLHGAGVHGALIMYVDEFNADVLADISGIPSSATRRAELSEHFNQLLERGIRIRKWQKFKDLKAGKLHTDLIFIPLNFWTVSVLT